MISVGLHDGAGGVSSETIQEIIRERKAEKKERAEQKRLHDLKRIQEMKSKEGLDPIEIFPKKVWHLILDELHPEDRGKMWQLHPLFREMMEDSHLQKNLFPQVLKFKVDRFWRYNNNVRAHDYAAFAKLPLYLNLKLRLLSKSIRNEIDRCIERNLWNLIRGMTCLEKYHKPMRFALLSQSDNCIEKLDRFLASIPTPRLIYRSISISLHEGKPGEGKMDLNTLDEAKFKELFQEFRRKMTQFLERVGNQIWYFKFEATPNSREFACSNGICDERYHAFVEWLSVMPNLKWIVMDHLCMGRTSKCLDSFHRLEKLDFPKLDRLERVDLYVYALHPKCQKETRLVVKRILEGNPIVKFLTIAGGGWLDLVSSSSVGLPQLESINFTQGSLLKTLNCIAWALKRLTVDLLLEDGPINPVFQFLRKFPTLQQLSLKVSNVTFGNEDEIDFLMLPHLTEFGLFIAPKVIHGHGARHSFRFFFSLQFLLHCKNLRTLDWIIQSDCVENLIKSDMQGNMIEFGGGWGDLTKDSNVWQVFPYLKYVKTNIQDFVLHTRNERVYHRDNMLDAATNSKRRDNDSMCKLKMLLASIEDD